MSMIGGKIYEHQTSGGQSRHQNGRNRRNNKSGIILAGSAKEKPQVAEVVAVGPGGVVDGKEVKMELSVGDRVLISKYAGTEVKLDGVEYTILRQADVLARID